MKLQKFEKSQKAFQYLLHQKLSFDKSFRSWFECVLYLSFYNFIIVFYVYICLKYSIWSRIVSNNMTDCREANSFFSLLPCFLPLSTKTTTSATLLSTSIFTKSAEQRWSNPKVVGSIPTLVRVFLCPCVGPFPSVELTLTWFIWGGNLALHITL